MTEEVAAPKLYPQDDINGFQNGVCMDLRVRLAVDFLKAHPAQGTPRDAAAYVLELADELLTQAEAQGWVTPLGDGKLTEVEKNQAKRLGAFQVYQQLGGQAAAQEEQSRVVPAAPSIKRDVH